jgi:hypothetical protein
MKVTGRLNRTAALAGGGEFTQVLVVRADKVVSCVCGVCCVCVTSKLLNNERKSISVAVSIEECMCIKYILF